MPPPLLAHILPSEKRKEGQMSLIQKDGFKIHVLVVLLMLSLLAIPQSARTAQEKININTADTEELQKLPRVGPKVAQRIIDFRKENGKFLRIEDIMNVKGIGEKTYLRMKDMITVGEARTQKK
jgi:comEA protein